MWLWDRREERTPDGLRVPAVIHNDPEYATDLAGTPRGYKLWLKKVALRVERVCSVRVVDFRHVKGHSGDHGNDAADLYANLGRSGRPPQWSRT